MTNEHIASTSVDPSTSSIDEVHIPIGVLYTVFFLSGLAALVYQLIWQRALFTIYGTNTESVTIVVAAFMMGLGVGSLVGGELSKRLRISLLLVFAILEILIGLYGLVSLSLFDWVGTMTLGASVLMSGVISFLAVLIPTCFMGATLPMLVAHLVASTGNVGQSVGRLYFINTLGSAAACFLGAFVLFSTLGMNGSVWVASGINILVAATILLAFLMRKSKRQVSESPSL